MKVYLAGSISGMSHDNATEWRDYAKNCFMHPHKIEAFSPMRGKAYVSNVATMSEEELKSYKSTTMHSIVGINVRDFNDCKTADAILVNLIGAKEKSIGTVMEIAWARAFQIPVVIVMEKDNVHNHGMLTFGNVITDDLDDGIKAIIQLLRP